MFILLLNLIIEKYTFLLFWWLSKIIKYLLIVIWLNDGDKDILLYK